MNVQCLHIILGLSKKDRYQKICRGSLKGDQYSMVSFCLAVLLLIISKAIGAAVYTLSDVKTFCNSIAPNMEQAELNAKLIEASDIMDKIFDDTDKLYIEHKLDSIP